MPTCSESLATELAGKIVVDCVNPLGFDKQGPFPLQVAAGSAAQEAQQILPDSTVIAAFHHVSAVLLDDPDIDHLEGDVLVLGEDRDAVQQVCDLATAIPGARGIYAGRLRNAGQVEALTANLIAINRRYKAHSSIADHGPAVRHPAVVATIPPRHTLHIVSGKGGIGKTTIAAALACALATQRPPGPAVRGGGP